jgi:hypothetical protein
MPYLATAMRSSDFERYPPQGRHIAEEHLATLRPLPVFFVALLLRELIGYDWQFPAERAELLSQLEMLKEAGSGTLNATMQLFAALPVSPELQTNTTWWTAKPDQFIEKQTAYLWTVHATDAFRSAATQYGSQLAALSVNTEPAQSRLCIVLVGRDAPTTGHRLFEKLRPYGTYFSNVDSQGGAQEALKTLQLRAQEEPKPYAHWLIDGGAASTIESTGRITTISYESLGIMRHMLLDKMHTARVSGTVGPEDLRSLMAQMQPEQFAAGQTTRDEVLQHFELRLFTEGSGTQIFSTTFVQWAAREALRRARPDTLLMRYASRQVDRPMNELVTSASSQEETDARGSLIDADMGAYYTWINLTRLPGAHTSRFVAFHESGNQAVAVSPNMAQAASSSQSCTVRQILAWTG